MRASSHAFVCAGELRERIRTRQVSSEEVTAEILARIEATQPSLNAFITVDGANALTAARQADDAIRRGEGTGPLHGVPVSIKDIINTAGLRTTWGSRLMEHNVPDADAVAVERLKKAGAIIVGKTTTSEFAHKLLTDAPLFGATRNPWDVTLTPGGSSGGSAVAVAAGLGPLSLATDAGASTRLPAALTGIVGLKPTLGLVPHSQVPDGFNNFIHLGIMARTVADAALMLDVIAGEHRSDPHSLGARPPHALQGLQSGKLDRRLRIGWCPFAGNTLLDDEVWRVCEEALDTFRALDCDIETITEQIENAEPAWRILQQSHWAARFYSRIDEIAPKLDPSFVEGIRAGGRYRGQELLSAIYKRTQHFRTVQEWFAKYDLIVTPTASRPPLSVDHGALEPITINGKGAGDMRQSWVPYLNLFNLTGHPAISIPCGFSAAGLPVGLQIVGNWNQDTTVLCVAAAFEAARPWAGRAPAGLRSIV